MTAALVPTGGPAEVEPYQLPVTGSLVAARWATLVAAIALFTAAALGIEYGEQGLYQSDGLVLPQVYGQDLVSMVIVLPLLGLATWRASRGSARGLVVWIGALIYIAYWYHFHLGALSFGPIFLLDVALVASSLFALGVLIARVDVWRLAHRFTSAMPARSIGGLMIIFGTLFASMWILDVVERLGHREILDQAARGVYAVDLTIMLPLTIAAGFLLWRHTPWGYALSGPLLVNAFLSTLTVSVTSFVVRGDGMDLPGAILVVFGVASLAMAGCVAVYLRAMRV